MIDKYYECPKCHYNWNDGNILEVVGRLEIFNNKSTTELRTIANTFGWTPENQARFSSVVTISIGPSEATKGKTVTFFQCPGCRQLFNSETGESFISLTEAKYKLEENGSDDTELYNTSKE